MSRYSFRPDPSRDTLSEAIRCGWSYADDFVDPLLPNVKLSQESINVAAEVGKTVLGAGNVVLYIAGLGVVCGVSHDEESRPMFLTSLQKGVTLISNI